MRKPLRIAIFLACGLLLLAGLVVLGLYLASQHVPGGYRQALAADPQIQAEASDEMVRKTTALTSAVKKKGQWHARFSAEQINGWLAVKMKKDHPDLLPRGVSDPRVVIEPEKITLYCRFRRGNITSVLSLAVDVFLVETDVVALRIRRARAGLLPLPLQEILDRITRLAQRRRVRLQWKQAEGDPVAEMRLSLRDEQTGNVVRLESIEVGEGEVVVSGTTK